MSRTVLFAPETFNLAEVTRGVEIARHLSSAGVACVFAGYSRRYAHIVDEAGFAFHLLEPELTDRQADQLVAVDQGRGLRHPFTTRMLAERVSNERALIRELGADAVVIGTTLSQFISARAEGVPLVYAKPFAYSLPHVRHMRATGVLSRRTVAARILDDAAATVVRTVLPRIPVLPRAFPSVARAHGVSLPPTALEALDADLNLITTAPHLLPAGVPLPESYRVVGPVFASLPGPVPPLVAELASRPEPLIYVAAGSSGNRELVRSVLVRLAEVRCQVLAPVRQYLGPGDVHALPGNVHVTGWLPADRLGSAIDLAITHGGEGTVQTSSVQGWPFIGIPLQAEQRFNIQRCVEFGSARMVTPREVRRTDWPALVEDALADGYLRRQAGRMAHRLHGVDGAAAAAGHIAALVGA